jgi:hypothetical protein
MQHYMPAYLVVDKQTDKKPASGGWAGGAPVFENDDFAVYQER